MCTERPSASRPVGDGVLRDRCRTLRPRLAPEELAPLQAAVAQHVRTWSARAKAFKATQLRPRTHSSKLW